MFGKYPFSGEFLFLLQIVKAKLMRLSEIFSILKIHENGKIYS